MDYQLINEEVAKLYLPNDLQVGNISYSFHLPSE